MEKEKVVVLNKLSRAVYHDNITDIIFPNIENGLAFHSRFFNDNTSTEGFFVINEITKSIYVVFKGSKEIKDFLIDAEILMWKLENHPSKILVHIGFQNALMSVLPQLNSFPFKDYVGYEIYITGRSLGGGLATLACFLMNFPQLPNLVTFGSPRVGNREFADECHNVTKESIRVVYEDDVVPMVPVGFYHHVDSLLHLDINGNEIKSINIIKRLIYWWKAKSNRKLFSLTDHHSQLYLQSVINWSKK